MGKESYDKKEAAQVSHSNLNKRLEEPVWVLILIHTYAIWQFGADSYSHLPPILTGYVLGVLFALILPRFVVLGGRILVGASVVCILLQFLPLPPLVKEILYACSICACNMFVSIEAILVINLYSLRTALRDGIIGTLIGSPLIALLHFFPRLLDPHIFSMLSLGIQVLILLGLFRISTKNQIIFLQYRKMHVSKAAPGLLWKGTFFVYMIICLCTLFSATIAESVVYGIEILNISSIFWTILLILICFYKKKNPFSVYTVLLGVAAVGFLLWLLPIESPVLRMISIVLLGVCISLGNLVWFIASVLFQKWNSRIIAPVAVVLMMLATLLNYVLVETLRDHLTLLYAIYAGIMILLLIAYFLTESYFHRVWNDVLVTSKKEMPITQLPPLTAQLTPREAEVAHLAAQGYDNRHIAELLYISEQTVKTHMKNIYLKLEVHNRFALATKLKQ